MHNFTIHFSLSLCQLRKPVLAPHLLHFLSVTRYLHDLSPISSLLYPPIPINPCPHFILFFLLYCPVKSGCPLSYSSTPFFICHTQHSLCLTTINSHLDYSHHQPQAFTSLSLSSSWVNNGILMETFTRLATRGFSSSLLELEGLSSFGPTN